MVRALGCWRTHYSGTDSFTECGSFQVESTSSGRVIIKDATPATDGQSFYLQDNF